MTNMMSLWSTLALLAMGLTGLERVPTAALAHIQRSPNDLHRHLATRQRLAGQVGAHEKRSGSLKKNKRGQTCRPRPSASAAASTNQAAAVESAAAPSDSSPAASPTSTPAPSSAEPAASASASETNNNLVAIGASVGVSVGQPSPSQGSNSGAGISVSVNVGNAGITGGWTNQGSKFGAAWPNGNWAQSGSPNYIGNYVGSKTAWYYTWSPSNVGTADSLGLEFVPMLWGPNQVSQWWSSQGSWPSSVKNGLFFNEPNESSQSNIAASDSVQYWMNDMVPVRHNKGIALGSAATTSAPSGLTWVQDLISQCQQDGNSQADCTPDFVPIHWYSTDPNDFQQYVSNFHTQTGLDIWITEYACQSFTNAPQCDESQTWQLHQSMAAWFDSQDYVKRYSPFGMMENMQGVNQDNALMNPSGSITSLGSWYIWSA